MNVTGADGYDEGNPNVWVALEMNSYIGYDRTKSSSQQILCLNPLDADSDDDGVPDGEDGTGDSDGDGLPNCLDPDSDNDGLHDGTEMGKTVSNLTNDTNLNADWFKAIDQTKKFYDGVYYNSQNLYDYPNFEEDVDPISTTNPNRRDSDGDYVPDGTFCLPFAGSTKIYLGEDRNNNGGIADSVEVTAPPMGCDQPLACVPRESNPNDKEDYSCDTMLDSDCDGLADSIELNIGTDIYDVDSDDDGLSDGDEYFGKGKNLRWFGVKTYPCNPDTDRDGLPDGLELGLIESDAIPDHDPIIPVVGLFGGTARDPNSENDKYFFETKVPFGELRRVRRFIPDGDPDSRSDPAHRDTNRDGHLDSESDMNLDGIVDEGKTDPALGLFVHPNEPWHYDETGTLHLPVMPTEGPFVLAPLGDGKYLTNRLDVYIKHDLNKRGILTSTRPSTVNISKVENNILPQNIEQYSITTYSNRIEDIGISYHNDTGQSYQVPLPSYMEYVEYDGYWPPYSHYSENNIAPGPDIDHIQMYFTVVTMPQIEYYTWNPEDSPVIKDIRIREYIKKSALNWNLKPEFLAAIILRESVFISHDKFTKWLGEVDIDLNAVSGLRASSMGPAQVEYTFAKDLIWERFGIYRKRNTGNGTSGTFHPASWQHSFAPTGLYRPVDLRFARGTKYGPDWPENGLYRLPWGEVKVQDWMKSGDLAITYNTCIDPRDNNNDGVYDDIIYADYFIAGNLMQNYAFNVEMAAQQIRRTASSRSKYNPKLWKSETSPYSNGNNPFYSPSWLWAGYSFPKNIFPSIFWYYSLPGDVYNIPDFDMSVLEEDGNIWPYTNKSLFFCWENLYDHGYYNLKDPFRPYRILKKEDGSYWSWAPSLEDCYNIICNSWSE